MNKYYMEPPNNIQVAPMEFLQVKQKFEKQAFKELLESCSQLLGTAAFKGIFTVEGDLV